MTSYTKLQQRSHEGMTLVEVMVAMAILAMITTMIWGAFSQTNRHKKRMDTEIDHYHEVRSAMERMVRELSMAFVSVHQNPSPSLQNVRTALIGKDRGEEDRIDFTSFSHYRLYQNAHESDQNEISYFVTYDPEDPGSKVLARREQRRIDKDPQKGGSAQIMVWNITAFDLEYLDPLSSEWVRTWDTSELNAQPNRMPAQIKIKLSVQKHKGSKSQDFVTRATIPIRYALNHAVYSP